MNPRYFVFIALGILLLGCASQSSPKEMLARALEKSESVTSLYSEIEMNVTTVVQGSPNAVSAYITQRMSAGKIRSDISITGMPELEGTELRSYALQNGSYICGKTDSWDCIQADSVGEAGEAAAGMAAFAKRTRMLLEADALEFTDSPKITEIEGRKCTFLSARINYTKARESLPDILPEGVKSAAISQCLDEETGIALQGALIVEEENALSQITFLVKKLEPNGIISEEEFSLPTN
ncbi:MAG: hypothetical protein ABIF01_01295 [Candidatus Micrarchaeota archaeon]